MQGKIKIKPQNIDIFIETDLQQWCQDNSLGERIVFSINSAETTGYPHAKE